MTRILIVDDHPLVRAGVRQTLLRDESNIVVGEARDGSEALQKVIELRPDLVTLDIMMPGLPIEKLAEAAYQLLPDLKILIVSSSQDEAVLRRVKKVRIAGYLLKDEAPEHLLQAARAIRQGAAWFSTTIVNLLMNERREGSPETIFTARELEVLTRMADGMENQKISQELCLAEQTVRNYATTIYSKINVTSRVEAVVWARERGMGSKAINPR